MTVTIILGPPCALTRYMHVCALDCTSMLVPSVVRPGFPRVGVGPALTAASARQTWT